MDFLCFYFPLFCIHWLMGNDLLPANSFGNAHHFRTYPVGVFAPAQMGRRMGEVAHEVSDGAFLRGDALLRGIISMCNTLIISIVILQNTST